MMNKVKTSRYLLLATLLPGSAFAEFDMGNSGITVEGYLQNRSSVYTKSGSSITAATPCWTTVTTTPAAI